MAVERFDAQLLDGLIKAYKTDDLREVCFQLGIDDEQLEGRTKNKLARELIGYMRRHGRLNELVVFLRGDRPHISWPDPLPEPNRPGSRVPLQFPPTATYFTGRRLELEQLLKALQPGRIVTLYGPGGIGKTALATEALATLHAAGALLSRFPSGVLFHSFYGRPAVADCAAELARCCGLDPSPDSFDALADALRDRVALLVLDGAEEADDLDSLLERRGRCSALITSRRRADVKEIGIEVERLPPDDALALLWALANSTPLPQGEGVRFPSQGEGSGEGDAHAICELCGNLPLALRLAGAFLFREGQSAAEYAAWLGETGLEALDFGDRRRESVPILMAKSVAQVSEQAQKALGVVGCLALQPFDAAPVAAALKISDWATRRVLGNLVDYELVRRAGERYEVTHALVYTYARERGAVEKDALRRLGEYYASLAEKENIKGPTGFKRLGLERDHIKNVLLRLAAAWQWTTANQLVIAVDHWLEIQGLPRDRIAVLEVGIAAAQILERGQDKGLHIMGLGVAKSDLGEHAKAIELYKEALLVFRGLNDIRNQAHALGNMGRAYYDLGLVKQAIDMHESALAIAKELGDPRLEGMAQGQLANAYSSVGQIEQSIEKYEAALAIAQNIGDKRQVESWLGNLGNIALRMGQVERAIEQYEAALVIAREIGDRRGEGTHQDNLGNAYAVLGQVERAIELYEAALAIYEAIKAPKAAQSREKLARLRGEGLEN